MVEPFHLPAPAIAVNKWITDLLTSFKTNAQDIGMHNFEFKWAPGDKLRDKITGLEGIVMVRAHYSTGCVHYGLLQDKLKDSKSLDWEWLDQSRLELVMSEFVNFSIDENLMGGPEPDGPCA